MTMQCGVQRRVISHMLHHSFATHLLEQGFDLRIIQKLSGHESSTSTEIYPRASRANIKKMPNLLDDLEI